MKKTISELDIGQLVHGVEGYSRVKVCVHGRKYYAYIGEEEELNIVEVSDDDEDHLDCCN